MGRSRQALCCACLLLPLLSASAAGEIRLFLVPQGADPTKFPGLGPVGVDVRTLGTITLEIFIESSDPVEVQGVCLILLNPAECGDSAVGRVRAVSAHYDAFRLDGLLPGTNAAAGVTVEAAFVCIGAAVGNPRVVTSPKYCGEITYEAEGDACGEFFVNLTDAVLDNEIQTRIVSSTGETLPFASNQAVIQIANEGDTDYDGTVDLFDILCVLDGFAGRFDRCTLHDVDLAPCSLVLERGDGEVNIGDIFVVLEAFQGNDPCPPSCASRCAP